MVSIGRLVARFGYGGLGVSSPGMGIQVLDVGRSEGGGGTESGPQTVTLGPVPASDSTVRPVARFGGARFDSTALALSSVRIEIDDLTHAVMSLFSKPGLHCLPDHNSFISLVESEPRAMATSYRYDKKCYPAIVRRREQNLL